MSRKCKIIVYGVVFLSAAVLFLGLVKLCIYYGAVTTYFVLKGETEVELKLNDTYKEAGVIANHHFESYEDKIVTYSNVNTSKIGTYKITYEIPSLNQKITRIVKVKDKINPSITLKGSQEVYTYVNEPYKDEGANAVDNYDGDLSNQIKMQSNVNTGKEGIYQIIYRVRDKSGNTASVKRKVIVAKDPMQVTLNYNYDEYDNAPTEWWFKKSENHKRNEAAVSKQELKRYDAHYIGKNEKVIYLTFDEGGSETTYIKEIADILNRYEIKGTFYLTRNYILKEADFIRELVASGHLIGNHTHNHLDMSSIANAESVKQFVDEVTSVEKAYMQVTGKKMIKTFRFPKGEASIRTMKMLQDLGYKTFFWSHAYYDYGPALSYQEAYNAMRNYYHPGAIYLMHPNNKGNYLALEDFIQDMIEEGYTFKTVDVID